MHEQYIKNSSFLLMKFLLKKSKKIPILGRFFISEGDNFDLILISPCEGAITSK